MNQNMGLMRRGSAPPAFSLTRKAEVGGHGCWKSKTHRQGLDLAYLRLKRPQALLQSQIFCCSEADCLCTCPCWKISLSLHEERSCVLLWSDVHNVLGLGSLTKAKFAR